MLSPPSGTSPPRTPRPQSLQPHGAPPRSAAVTHPTTESTPFVIYAAQGLSDATTTYQQSYRKIVRALNATEGRWWQRLFAHKRLRHHVDALRSAARTWQAPETSLPKPYSAFAHAAKAVRKMQWAESVRCWSAEMQQSMADWSQF